jgi:molybdenum cofactor synthesis domain-containing protein
MTPRTLVSASILAVGTELTSGSTRDTNSGDLARDLTAMGVAVVRMAALPDDLAAVTEAIGDGLARSDLVVVTGGLGPTPDDLTREAIAAACGETPEVDPALEAWLTGLFARRGIAMPAINRKQAWLIPSATSLDNGRGTAPGWWVDRPDGRLIVALPGPPSEMRPMWQAGVVPRLHERGVGADRASVTLRLTGIGESALADLVGEERLRRRNPEMATYARLDAVDLRISATGDGRRSAADLITEAEAEVGPIVAPYRFASGDETWVDALTHRLDGRRLATVEIDTAGQLAALLASAPWFVFGETLARDSALARAHGALEAYATRVREVAGTEVGLAVRARERAGDTSVTVATDIDGRASRVTHTAFLGGDMGRRRAALIAASELWRRLDDAAGTDPRVR